MRNRGGSPPWDRRRARSVPAEPLAGTPQGLAQSARARRLLAAAAEQLHCADEALPMPVGRLLVKDVHGRDRYLDVLA